MESRRDVLRIFGAGAIILPAAATDMALFKDVDARLVEPAKVELIDRPQSILTPADEFRPEEVVRTRVAFTMADGRERVLEAQWCRGQRTSGSPGRKAGLAAQGEVLPTLMAGDRIQFDVLMRRTDFAPHVPEQSPASVLITEAIIRGGGVIR